MSIGIPEIILVVVVVLLLFGAEDLQKTVEKAAEAEEKKD